MDYEEADWFWQGLGNGIGAFGFGGDTGNQCRGCDLQPDDPGGGRLLPFDQRRVLHPRDANGSKVSVFRYNGTVYAPVRAVCEAAGMDVDYNSATRTVELTTADQLTTGDYITEAEAKSIALKDAGVKESAAVFLTVRLDWDDGRPEYEVEFYSGQTEYDYEIHAVTGAILSSDRDLENFEIPTVSASSDDMISAEKAKSIALERAPSGHYGAPVQAGPGRRPDGL